MNNAEKKKTSWLKIARPIALALVLVFLLSCATYAWMKRDWTPSIHQDNVKIVAGSSLTFLYNGESKEDIQLNTLIGKEDFTYKSVSSATGKSEDFFALEYSTKGKYEDTLKKLALSEASDNTQSVDMQYTSLGLENGYIDITFHIQSASADEGSIYDQTIYLHKDSHIDAAQSYYENGIKKDYTSEQIALNQQAAEAMRVSITTYNSDGSHDKTVIFTKSQESHIGITSDNGTKYGLNNYVAHGAKLYDAPGKPATEVKHSIDGELRTFPLKESAGATKLDDAGSIELLTIKPGETRAITVRIWLEGEDPLCQDEIAGTALDILIKFTATPA